MTARPHEAGGCGDLNTDSRHEIAEPYRNECLTFLGTGWAVLGILRFTCANFPLLAEAEYEYASDSSAAACNTFAEASYSARIQHQSHQFLLLCSIGSPTTTSAYLHHENNYVRW